MLDKLFGYRVHHAIHILCFVVLCIGLPLNKVVMSLATMLCAINLLLDFKFADYLKNLRQNKVVLLVLLLFGFHLLGLLYTSNFDYAFHDLRVKLPLLALPFVYGARPISRKELELGLGFFLLSLTVTTVINFVNFYLKSAEGIILDLREMSLFASHIRYSLLVVFGVSISLIYCVQRRKYYVIYALLFAWFSWYVLYSQVLSGVLAYTLMCSVLFVYALTKLKITWMRRLLILIFFLSGASIVYSVVSYISPDFEEYVYGELDEYSAEGNHYYNDTTATNFENGHPLMVYIVEEELRREWNKVSTIPYDSLDRKNQQVKYTLWRYLTSMNQRKDALGVKNLSDKDVFMIENGIATIEYQNGGFKNRLNELKIQLSTYMRNGNPNGQSLLQRFEHWNAARHIIKEDFFFGVGTGDVQDVFDKAYVDLDSKLDVHYRNRAHNQFLTFWVSFGIFGLFLFIAIWVLYLKKVLKERMLIALCFGIIAIASFLPEDTIETQHGVTFIALFITVFSSLAYHKQPE